MKALGPRAQSYYQRYLRERDDWQEVAEVAEGFIRQLLVDEAIQVHLVSARAKSPGSLLAKIRLKEYGDPYRQLTDRVGVRIVTYYRRDVDRVVEVIRPHLVIDQELSVDKRTVLGLEKFGYRSVHLIAELDAQRLPLADRPTVKGRRIEIQVRSLLEHAWAAIDHEIVYKSGIRYEDEVLREFAAVAGALEVLDTEFERLRGVRNELVDSYRSAYEKDDQLQAELDVARLLAFLEARFPDGLSWRARQTGDSSFPLGTDIACSQALSACGITTAEAFDEALQQSNVSEALEGRAAQEGISRNELSHLAIIVVAVGVLDNEVLTRDFPDLAELFLPSE